ncbi:MAG: DUF302 domain-containing protein [Pseudomonadota bacterium]
MKTLVMIAFLGFIWSINVQADSMHKNVPDNMIVKLSANTVTQTMDRLEKILKSKGVTVFLRLDHAKGANKVGKNLRPTQLLIFGNPKLGSPLMMSNQTIGIDLPLKAIAWEDVTGKVWLAYNKPSYLGERHQINDKTPVIAKMTKVLNKFSSYAVGK